MSIDGDDSRRLEVHSFDKDALFTLWFHSINLCFSRVGICKNNQGIAGKKKVKNTDTSRADIEKNISRANVEEEQSIGRIKNPGISRANKLDTGGVNKLGISRANKLGIGGINKSGKGGVDKPGRSKIDKPNIDGVNKPGTSRANKQDIGRANKSGIGKPDKSDISRAKKVEG